ncbi:DUF72 domain-containing protein [Delftia sp. PS-11]|uniref:DUF72 domain-containing protein n=1 Tax=Delftia sp. PS-11 TaxID=2767222 RepID=UPI0024588384|nr:DUF72 domain-containing protein [Delftia sp. PS-11]KAJ8744553.1 DUF72 domain-containing protein [Delftia sp. PS-11]
MQDDLFGPAPSAAPSPAPCPAPGKAGAGVRLAPDALQWQALAGQLPAGLRMGVSTWSYPGWAGLVWDGAYDASVLSKNGLQAYGQHPLMRTVCVDRSFWRPLTASQYAAYAGQVPTGFRFVLKCPSAVTDAQVRSEDGRGQSLNPAFLQPELAVSSFVGPALEGLGEKLGALVFQLSPLTWGLLSRPAQLLARLQAMLEAVRAALAAHPLGPQVIVAVEVRDPELLTPHLATTLRAAGATLCLGLHGKMPPIEEQLKTLRLLWPTPLVCRWNLNREFGAYGYPDAQKKHEPFDEIRSPDPHTRAVLAKTIAGITGRGQPAFVTISNDAEGCAPRSIALLAQAVAELAAAAPQRLP